MRYIISLVFIMLFFACGNEPKGTEAISPEEMTELKKKVQKENPTPVVTKTDDPKKLTGFASPECVHWNGQFFFVSNVGKELKPSEKDGDGFISTVSFSGKIKKEKFITGLDAPKGMIQVNNSLYVTDIDKVRIFDAKTGEATDLIDFSKEKATFLNDLTFAPGKIFVSATALGQIFEINIKTNEYKKVEAAADFTSVNGLHYNFRDQTLYYVGFGKNGQPNGGVYAINFKEEALKAEKICDHQGMLDGVDKITKTELLVSDWNGDFPLIKINLNDGSFEKIAAPEKINGPADFSFSQRGNMLWIPAMQDNAIHGFKINTREN